jgi:hypothetical protein
VRADPGASRALNRKSASDQMLIMQSLDTLAKLPFLRAIIDFM